MQRNQLGFSLVELMISITLGLFLMTGVVQMFLGSKQTFSSQQAVSRVQETGRLAVEFISRDIRMASYYGCFSPKDGSSKKIDVVPANLAIAGLHSNFGVGVMGYKDSTKLPNSVSTDLGATMEPVANTNILVLRGADSQSLLAGSAINEKNEIYAYTTSALVDKCINGICKDSAVVVSDCKKARVFKVSDDPSAPSADGTLTLKHTEDWGGGDKKAENFDKLSEVAPIKTVVYFVAKGKGADGGPSLYQRINKEDPVELVEDVENVYFTYGVNGTNYKKTEDMGAAEWAQVTAVKIELLVRSDMDNVVENKQPYTFATKTVAQADVPDKRIRKVFMATVGVRSRS